jgi:hypothetical protein
MVWDVGNVLVLWFVPHILKASSSILDPLFTLIRIKFSLGRQAHSEIVLHNRLLTAISELILIPKLLILCCVVDHWFIDPVK